VPSVAGPGIPRLLDILNVPIRLTRRRALAALSLAGVAPVHALSAFARQQPSGNHAQESIYGLKFTYSLAELIGDIVHSERGDPRMESVVPHGQWYSRRVREKSGAWGPKPRTYPPVAGIEDRPLAWKRERVIATAARFIGYSYQHHHIPDWDPPADWPWKHSCAGHNGKGVDCSNFTSFVYNQGFGIRMTSEVVRQSELHSAVEAGVETVRVGSVDLPVDYAGRQKILRTGDLVYIRGREHGPITHVVIWVGEPGQSPSGVPLVMDSHGPDVTDDDGRPIPCGIQLRPFRQDSWYDRCASHAHRVFHESQG
jgi:cell wall-associated NlpC family hydrolase